MASDRRSGASSSRSYKEDVKKRGKPFFPYAMFHDTVMSLVVVVGDHRARGASGTTRPADPRRAAAGLGLLGPRYTEPADPGTTNFVPRPDWYFYFLFYLLRIFKWPDSVILGTVGIPTILLIIADPAAVHRPAHASGGSLAPPGRGGRRDPRRHLDGRPDVQGRDREGGARAARSCRPCRRGRSSRASPTTRGASPGAKLFASSGCTALPHLPRHRRLEPRRARPHRRSARAARASTSSSATSQTRRSSATT